MSKYNDKIVKSICEKIENGITKKDTATLCGLDESTFFDWMKKPKFSKSVELADARYIEKMVNIVNIKATKEPTGRLALEILSRRRPND